MKRVGKIPGARRAIENPLLQSGGGLRGGVGVKIGAAGESIAFGLGVTMPAIMILGFDMEIARVMLVAVLGGLLGILMMIPLRRALIVEQHGILKYPEGTACAEVLKAGATPTILQVGFSVLYAQAHIPGAIYAGPGNKEEGIDNLRTQAKNLAKDKPLVIYCGCCPWEKCPNIAAAWKELTAEGFKNLKVLYLADNFGADWADKGYPIVKGS